jgi:hypothetical protein
MQRIVKLPIVLIFGLMLSVSLIGLTGCGSQDQKSSGITVKDQGAIPALDHDFTIEKTTLIDIPEVTVVADSASFQNDNLSIQLTLTNKTSKPLSVCSGTNGFSANYINNYMVNSGYLVADLEPNETITKDVTINAQELQLCGIREIGVIGLGLLVKNNKTSSPVNFDQITQQVVAIKTNKYESVDLGANTYPEAINDAALLELIGATMVSFNDEGGFDQNGISIESVALIKNAEEELTVMLEIKNGTDKLIGAIADDISIDSEMVYESRWTTAIIDAGKTGFLSINLDDVVSMKRMLDDNDDDSKLETISQAGIEFSVVDAKSNTIISPVELEFSF